MLLFDKINHGAAINISSDGLSARRITGFANGIVFTNRPINIFEKITFELQQQPYSIWQGSLRLGLYTGQQIPTDDLPLSTMESNLSSSYTMVSLDKYINLYNEIRLTVWLTQNYCLNYAINNVLRGTLIDNNQIDENNNNGIVPPRLVFDLFGNTIKVQLIRDDDVVPYEIKARGPDAIRYFQTACDTGTTSVRRTLLLMIGPKLSGKSSLKQILISNNNNNNSDSYDLSTDLSSSCSINIDQAHTWSLSKTTHHSHPTDDLLSTVIQDFDEHELSKSTIQKQEYESQLVHNIILNLLKRRYELHTVHEKKDKNWKETLLDDLKLVYPSPIIPLTIRSLIEKQLTQMKSLDPHAVLANLMNNTIKPKSEQLQEYQRLRLDLWDMAGSTSSSGITHQIFLSSRAIYLLVFDLSKDLDQPCEWNKEITNLEHLNYIMHSVFCYSANINQGRMEDDELNDHRLSPPIVLVGTHRNLLTNSTKQVTIENKLAKIRAMISTKPYCKHVVEPYFTVDTHHPDTTDYEQIDQLKQLIEDVTLAESYIGEQIPTRWLQFENDLNRLKKQDNFYASLDQICEIARTQDICSSDELKTLLDFYHDLGVIVYFGNTQDMFLKNTLILRPQKLIQLIKRLVCNNNEENENDDGIIDERTFENLCQPFIEQKQSLLALLKKFDLLCERTSLSSSASTSPTTTTTTNVCKQYYVPGSIRRIYNEKLSIDKDEQSIVFYYVFNGYFPESLFHQILVRTIKWTQSNNVPSPKLYYRRGKFILDDQHLLILTASSIKYARMKVQIIRNNPNTTANNTTTTTTSNNSNNSSNNNKNQDEINPQLADPAVVAKVRKFLESLLNEIKSTWIRRLAFQCMVVCPCGKICDLHKTPYCSNNLCLHFLNLDHCLSNPIVECSFRRVPTNQYRNWFPKLSTTRAVPIIDILYDQKSMNHFFEDSNLPNWVRSTAKLLSTSEITINLTKSSSENRTWVILAKKLGYQQSVIDQFSLSRNPSLQLITDWIVRSGNSSLAVDMLLATMKQIGRDDLVDIISREREAQYALPSVFLSYQWDIQDEVKELRNFLELVGFTCWMDMGQIGGGELLYEKIDHGIRNAKIIISCITPMYICSNMCQRELILADMLKKPIVPVMFELTPWPPIGAASLILSQLAYVDLKGAGGHGGSGRAADLQARYNEIASMVSRHTTSSSPSTFRRLVHSSSIDKRAANHPSSALASLTTARNIKQTRNHQRRNTDSLNSNESSNSSMSEDDFDYDYNETDGSDHPVRPIEPILTAANIGPTVGAPLTQPFQIRSSVHLEHRLGPMTTSHQPPAVTNRIASCTVCSIL
ncbi:unnamed protein product [Adineta steineri]|uniref:Uncharacterized protein n=1 Tax=Adineta steineri TaxID=433720 RepID=A0A814NGH9_9BILA|nr:unnamed protein product [Adineta steineri]CAF1091931.1 unnamed protein product [Adineta steineri]